MSYSDTTPNLNLPQWTDQDGWDVADLTAAMSIIDGNPEISTSVNGICLRWANGIQMCVMKSDVRGADTIIRNVFVGTLYPKPFLEIYGKFPSGLNRVDGLQTMELFWPMDLHPDRLDAVGSIRAYGEAGVYYELQATCLTIGRWK